MIAVPVPILLHFLSQYRRRHREGSDDNLPLPVWPCSPWHCGRHSPAGEISPSRGVRADRSSGAAIRCRPVAAFR